MRNYCKLFLLAIAGQGVWPVQAMDLLVADKAIVESGQELFKRNCARCHGDNASGSAVDTGKETVHAPALTTLAKRNGGMLPIWGVYEVVSGSKVLAEHRTRTMPIWGEEFAKARGVTKANKESIVRGRILAILAYLSTIQEK